jgi:hypothetical protein
VHAKGYISRRSWVDHRLPSTEPLLWIPDVVAGAVGDAREANGHENPAVVGALVDHALAELGGCPMVDAFDFATPLGLAWRPCRCGTTPPPPPPSTAFSTPG